MKVSDFNYHLPEKLIAQKPASQRHMSRLMVVDRKSGTIEHTVFSEIIRYFEKGDCIVLNNTRVIPARLLGKREDTNGKIEFILLNDKGQDVWEVILKPGKRAKPGNRFIFGNGELKAEVLEVIEDGNRLVRFEYEGVFENILDEVGIIPLPPYITEKPEDYERYQTVYSKARGSAAAPTAGLHFTEELIEALNKKGIDISYVTLHIGLGTFRPVKSENIIDHKMHSEYFSIDGECCAKINNAKKQGNRIIGVGTTSGRVLETVCNKNGIVQPGNGWTDIFIYPGYKFKVIDCMVTNFHMPESTLIMLVSAFAGRDKILKAYNTAVMEKYRFFSFGDAMLIL